MTRPIAAIVLAGLLLLAGCSGGVLPGTDSPTQTGTAGDGGEVGASSGTVHFYVSDEENAISDFEHLNVTVTRVGFQRAGGGDDEATESPAGTETRASTGAETTDGPSDSATPTGTATPSTAESPTASEESGDDGKAGWEEFAVENETVDLTTLQGDNATLVDSFDLEAGSYDTVFIYVGAVEGTLANGERVTVKLPSEKLQLHERFEVGGDEEVEFVFDITVHEAGKSGKYVLSPVASESGTDVPMRKVDRAGNPDADDEGERDDRNEGTDESTVTPTATTG